MDSDTILKPKRVWTQNMEKLVAAFVGSLFAYSMEGDPTWPNLHSLLQNSEKNILFDHLSHNEDMRLRLEPDCADLPYYLRAYFAWKMALPFGFRKCDRGRPNRPPMCEAEAQTNLMSPRLKGTTRAFNRFMRGPVKNQAHSACGRTGPDNDETDLYPVPLDRTSLRPGTVYADPYGHLLIVVRWEPQGIDRYGVLVAADAQPDGTVGLKRFWRGTFLFLSDTTRAGGGFKAFRPLIYHKGSTRTVKNASLARSERFIRFSREQYDGSEDDFYDRMDELINPRALDPFAMQTWLVDALEEAVQFRVVSVNNGERYKQSNPGVIKMPRGKGIFWTAGPWEDFSTPSRDMRILIAIYTVIGFPDKVARAPERYGLEQGPELAETVTRLRTALNETLAARSFVYTRSDGKEQTLTLKDVVDRREYLEMAYNPNDCIEVRWGAPKGSDEWSACKRRAPGDQQAKMAKYRKWFANRQRPL